MNLLQIDIARKLLRKNISFCIYRFPGEADIHLAVESKYLQDNPSMLIMAPFINQSTAREIKLGIVEGMPVMESLAEIVKNLPDREINYKALPKETTRKEYYERIDIFLNEIQSGALHKAILSRVFWVDKPKGFDPFDCFLSLCNGYPKTFVHLLYHPEAGMWMGATPELLLQKEGKIYKTMALAGTQPRKSEGAYQWRQKEMDEHTMVGQHIEKIFGKYGCDLRQKKGPNTIESGQVAHLQTDYSFTEKGETNPLTIVNELHPTPAVGGLPVDKGVDCIVQNEGYDRRYYCGYIGETNSLNIARLFINLRCMQIGENHIAIYCGGGITAASDPEEEWNETVQKSLTMLQKISPEKVI